MRKREDPSSTMEGVALLFLTLILPGAPCLATGIPVQPGFDYRKVEGLWRRVAVVGEGENQTVVGPEIQISPMPKGDLSVGRNIVVRLTCRFVDFRYRNSGQPGVFNVFHANGDQSTIHVMDTDYSGYLVLHAETGDNSAVFLFARGPEVSDSLKEKFADHVISLGFSKVDIKYPDQDGQCPFSQSRPKQNQR